MAQTFYSACLQDLRPLVDRMERFESFDGESDYQGIYLGSYMSLDPCGRYHHCLSPNGATDRCERFWEALERAADRLGGWIESGEGDPTDIFFCMSLPEGEEGEEGEECSRAQVAENALALGL